MFPLLIILSPIIGIVMILIGFHEAEFHSDKYKKDRDDGKPENLWLYSGSILFAATAIAAFMMTALWPMSYYSSHGDVTKMEAFYNDTLSAYTYTIEQTSAVNVENSRDAILIDLTYQEQSQVVSQRILELRNRVNDYNEGLAFHRKFHDNWAASSFVAGVPDYLKPIHLK